ncbi:class I SAM-dependent methyltransferase [Marinilabiliaceae bacterium JC017]|nr:class I SAM-dependent methyltransferase [Marinilabiliaceae bacterium JC017]
MTKQQWYERLFSNFANKYEKEVFTQGTVQEVDFLEELLQHDKRLSVLDVGCGTGRHAIELARRGYAVTGIDLSENMLQKAREKAVKANVEVTFIQADARSFVSSEKYDLVIMLCEGGFSLMETDEMNYAILKNARAAMKEKGQFVFTCLNALFPLFHSVKEFMEQGSGANYSLLTFDWVTFREHSNVEMTDDDGQSFFLNTNERYYAPSEITWMLKSLGLDEVEIFGGEVGNFSRCRLTPDYFELLVIAR